jgi:hypothetical protein
MLQSGLSITYPSEDVSEWPEIMKNTTSRQINAVYGSAQRIVATVVAILFTVFTLMLLRMFGGNLISAIMVGFLPACVAIISWGFALRGHIAKSRGGTTSPLVGDVTEWPDTIRQTPTRKINTVYAAAQRIVAIVVAIISTVFTLLLLWSYFRGGGGWQEILMGLFPAAIAIICWGFALRGHIAEGRRRTKAALVGGIMLGGIGLAGGYFGPLMLSESNLGPLLGIFMTGPLGFVLGAIIGWFYARIRASS